jgi:NADH dehydrogenase
MAAFIKEVACKATLWTIRLEGHRPGSPVWPKGGPRPAETAATTMENIAT